jgi:hypothetical protein
MKKVAIVFILSLFAGMASFSQEINSDKVPATVRQSFVKQYPAAKSVEYEKNNTDYVISFNIQDKKYIVTYNSLGNVLETDKEITPAALPMEVSSAVIKNFSDYKIEAVVRREAVDKGVCYEMDLKKDDAGYSVRFSDKGEILQKIPRRVEFQVTTKSKK